MARRKPKTLRYKAGKLIASTSKAAKRKVKKSQKALRKQFKSASKNIARQKRKAQRLLKSKSRLLAKETNRQRKKALRQARKIQKSLKRSGKRRVKELRRFAKKTTKEARRARRLLNRKVKSGRKAASRFFKNRKRAARARERQRKSLAVQQRRQARLARRARTQIDLEGTADISTARVVQASEDRGASRPGEPPKLRTGKGRSSIKAQLRLKGQKLESRVYVDKKIAPYMAMWEFRKDGKGRPFLKPSVENNKDQFGKIIGSELKQANKGGRRKAVVK